MILKWQINNPELITWEIVRLLSSCDYDERQSCWDETSTETRTQRHVTSYCAWKDYLAAVMHDVHGRKYVCSVVANKVLVIFSLNYWKGWSYGLFRLEIAAVFLYPDGRIFYQFEKYLLFVPLLTASQKIHFSRASVHLEHNPWRGKQYLSAQPWICLNSCKKTSALGLHASRTFVCIYLCESLYMKALMDLKIWSIETDTASEMLVFPSNQPLDSIFP